VVARCERQLLAHSEAFEHFEKLRQRERTHQWLVGSRGNPASVKLEAVDKLTEIILREFPEWTVLGFAKLSYVIGRTCDSIHLAFHQFLEFVVGFSEHGLVD
jgi:hypothetical protein